VVSSQTTSQTTSWFCRAVRSKFLPGRNVNSIPTHQWSVKRTAEPDPELPEGHCAVTDLRFLFTSHLGKSPLNGLIVKDWIVAEPGIPARLIKNAAADIGDKDSLTAGPDDGGRANKARLPLVIRDGL